MGSVTVVFSPATAGNYAMEATFDIEIDEWDNTYQGRTFEMKKLIFIGILLAVFPVTSAKAINITYEALNLGAGSWQFDYYVSNFDFDTDYGFQIFYEYGLYENITPVSDASDWDEIAWDPDLIIPDDGVYDAMALVDNASLSEPFSVQFNWLGPHHPNGQYYEIYDDGFAVVDSGRTAPVPEPATVLLLGAGLAGLGFLKKLKHLNL